MFTCFSPFITSRSAGSVGKARKSISTSRAKRRRLRFEWLEDRRVLAAIMVTSLADNTTIDGEVTLREAIQAANLDTSVDGSIAGSGEDIISFDPTLFGSPQTIKLTLGELSITESLTITGRGQDVHTIDAQQQSRIFNVVPGSAKGDVTFTIVHMTLTGGRTTESNQLVGGSRESTHSGGAIRFNSKAILYLFHSRITGNTTSGDYAYGGGVYSVSWILMGGSTISRNSTLGDAADGGGVY